MQAHKFRQARLTQAVIVALLLGSGTAMAQQPTATSIERVQSQPVSVNITAQSMQTALEDLAKQTGLQVIYATDRQTAGMKSPRVTGTYPLNSVLTRLLSGNQLTYEFVNAKTVSIRNMTAAEVAAQASVAGATASTQNPDTFDAITVTGSNLTGFSPAAPVITLTSEELERRGNSTVEDVLRSLPQNLASQTSASQALNQREYGNNQLTPSPIGFTSVNLRGLGSASTLILVNGRRRTTSSQGMGTFTDISAIPMSQIDYIEIVTDGASAIYGADAVAGVVNIVLKKDYVGTTAQLRFENSSNRADAAFANLGHTFSWGSGSLTASAAYERSKPSDLSKMIASGAMGPGDFRALGGVNMRRAHFGQPGAVFDVIDAYPGYYTATDMLGYIPANQSGDTLQPGDLIANAPMRSTYEYARVGPETERKALRFDLTQNLGKIDVEFGLGYTRQNNRESWRPMMMDFSPLNAVLNDFSNVVNYTYVPDTNNHNTFGKPVAVSYSYAKEFEGMRFSNAQTQDDVDAHLTFSGDVSWLSNGHWETGFSYGGQTNKGLSFGDFDGISGQPRPEIDAFYANVNPFGNGNDPAIVASNRALLAALVQQNRTHFKSRALAWDGLIRGDLFNLPAGRMQFVVGAQYRTDANRSENVYGSGARAAYVNKFSRDSKALFVETGIPLLKDKPFAKELTLSLAARAERFTQSGTSSLAMWGANVYDPATQQTTNLVNTGGFDITRITGGLIADAPPVGISNRYSNVSPLARLRWKPNDDLALRATWGRSFVTPSGNQSFGGLNVSDITYQFGGGNGVALPNGYTQVIRLDGPNARLQPQTATTMTYGFDYSPSFAKGLTVSATYNHIKFNNYIAAPFDELQLPQIFSPAVMANLPASMLIPGRNGVLMLDARNRNYAGRTSKSIDFNVDYQVSTDMGYWQLGLNAVRTLELSIQPVANLQKIELDNTDFGPSKWAGNTHIMWSNGGWNATLGANYTSGFRVMVPYSSLPNLYNAYTPNPNPRRAAGHYIIFDAQLGYTVPDSDNWLSGLGFKLGVQNMFNRKFAFVDNAQGFVANRSGIRGRVLYLDIKKEF